MQPLALGNYGSGKLWRWQMRKMHAVSLLKLRDITRFIRICRMKIPAKVNAIATGDFCQKPLSAEQK